MAEFWTGGAEMTRDLWLANGRKDAAIYRLTQAWEEKGYIPSKTSFILFQF